MRWSQPSIFRAGVIDSTVAGASDGTTFIQWGLGMRILKWAVLSVALSSMTSGAEASSLLDAEFFGYVSSAVETSESGPPKSNPLIVGEPFSAIVEILSGNPSPIGYAALNVSISGVYVLTIPGQTSQGASYFGNASFNGYAGSIPGFSFTYVSGSPSSDVLTASFLVAGINRADDSGALTLTLQTTEVLGGVSAVPLPRALPMFASGLLALGVFGFLARKKSATQPVTG
jgi:hypothetical protein